MDKDIAALSALLGTGSTSQASQKAATAIQMALGRPGRAPVHAGHRPAEKFKRGDELPVAITVPAEIAVVRLHYRHVDQAENFVTLDMTRSDSDFRAVIPAEYTRAEFPLEYYFEVRMSGGRADLFPGFAPPLTNQPYFVVQGS
jgi:hypothetical protein